MVTYDGKIPTTPEEIPSELAGLRMTKQRREVYSILLHDRDHPTANDVFRRVQDGMPSISLATVYNCLIFTTRRRGSFTTSCSRAAARSRMSSNCPEGRRSPILNSICAETYRKVLDPITPTLHCPHP
jgi:hypothetical protein